MKKEILSKEDKFKPTYINTYEICLEVLKEQQQKADEFYFIPDLERFNHIQVIRKDKLYRIQCLIKLENGQAELRSTDIAPIHFNFIRDFNNSFKPVFSIGV